MRKAGERPKAARRLSASRSEAKRALRQRAHQNLTSFVSHATLMSGAVQTMSLSARPG